MQITIRTFATIITIGDELLMGQVIDTNSAFIAKQLNSIGITLKRRVAIGDDKDEIINALEREKKDASIIIMTGGLGPTADDITKPVLCKYFGGELVVHQQTLEHITNLFENVLKRPMIERNIKQAEVPNVCNVLENKVGTAPGMLFEKDGVSFFSLPGVPYEMKWLMENKVIPFLAEKNTETFIEHQTLITFGVGESFIAEMLVDFENNLPKNIKLAYLPNYGLVRLRLTGYSNNKENLSATINQQFNQLKILVKDILMVDEDISIEALIGKLLKEQNKTVSTAESCTGGYISHLLTSVAGSSEYYEGSIISYSYAAKEKVLHVEKNILEEFGAVSEQTVSLMAKNVLELMNTDYSIAVSGIMGPGGKTADKPIGTVWMAVASKQKVVTKLFRFRFDRKKNIEQTATNALILLRELIVDKG